LKAYITSLRVGWNGKVGTLPLRIWVNGIYWDTFTTAKGSFTDSEGSTIVLEVDQVSTRGRAGPASPWA